MTSGFMDLIYVVIATFVAGVGSVWVASILGFSLLANKTQQLLSFAAGALLATALLHVLPEAFEGQTDFAPLFLALLLGILFFFLLDKAELWHHAHEHHGGIESVSHHDHTNQAPHSHEMKPPVGVWAVLMGDSMHCFGDGIMIAASFSISLELGLLASIAVLVHEIPHHMGDLVVVGQGAVGKKLATIKVSLAGAMTILGGVLGDLLVQALHNYLPYVMCVTASSFVYVALADLIPQLQKRLSFKRTLGQVAWLFAGVILVYIASHAMAYG